MATVPTKLDYSRLLDDEFLNRGECVRVHTVTRGAAAVLGSSASLVWPAEASSTRCTTALLKVALALALMAALTFVGLLVVAHQHHSQLRALAMPMQIEPTEATIAPDHFVLAGGFHHSEEDAHLSDEMHDHVLPGDVVVEDHHIVPAGKSHSPDSTGESKCRW